MKILFRFGVIAALCVCLSSTASAQVTDSQTFTVNVPTNITITAPSDVAITHDQSDSNQVFPVQTWSVVANTVSGVTVSLGVDQPFTHTTDPTYMRDCQLGLAIDSSDGPGVWTISQATDVTDYSATTPDLSASVAVASNGTGSASLDLTVRFVTGTYGSFAAGTYETTVVGTVTAN